MKKILTFLILIVSLSSFALPVDSVTNFVAGYLTNNNSWTGTNSFTQINGAGTVSNAQAVVGSQAATIASALQTVPTAATNQFVITNLLTVNGILTPSGTNAVNGLVTAQITAGGFVTNKSRADIVVTNAGVRTVITSNSITTTTFNGAFVGDMSGGTGYQVNNLSGSIIAYGVAYLDGATTTAVPGVDDNGIIQDPVPLSAFYGTQSGMTPIPFFITTNSTIGYPSTFLIGSPVERVIPLFGARANDRVIIGVWTNFNNLVDFQGIVRSNDYVNVIFNPFATVSTGATNTVKVTIIQQ